MKAARSIIIWTIGVILTTILYLAMLACSILLPFDKKRRAAHAQCYWWADAVTTFNPFWEMRVSGLENIDRKKTYVIVANHQSLADIVIVYKMRMQFKWVAKESLFNIPILGWCMSLGKHIELSRGNFSSIKKVYRQAAGWLRSGMSVLFFPEGTRSETDEMRDFQNGAFKLAIKERVPVLPVYIEGTGNAIPKGSWLFETRTSCRLTVFPAVDTARFEAKDFAVLRDIVRARMAGTPEPSPTS